MKAMRLKIVLGIVLCMGMFNAVKALSTEVDWKGNFILLNKTNHAIWYSIGFKSSNGELLVDPMTNFKMLEKGKKVAAQENRMHNNSTILYIYLHETMPKENDVLDAYEFKPFYGYGSFHSDMYLRLKEDNGKSILEPQTSFGLRIRGNVEKKDIPKPTIKFYKKQDSKNAQ
jgi:hypothetical protein